MISAARLAVERAEAGLPIDLDMVPAWQWEIWFAELARLCPDAMGAVAGRDYNRQRNALRIEIVPSSNRCKQQSPDGRGLRWLLSGGSPLSYGVCACATCPRAKGGAR